MDKIIIFVIIFFVIVLACAITAGAISAPDFLMEIAVVIVIIFGLWVVFNLFGK